MMIELIVVVSINFKIMPLIDFTDAAMIAHAPTTANHSKRIDLNLTSPQYPLYLFLLAYRWASLLLAMWLFIITADVVRGGISLAMLLAISIGSTVLITVLHIPRGVKLLDNPLIIGLDILLISTLLTFSGVTRSPFNLYALSPLLVGALFFQMRGALLAAGGFTVVYPLVALIGQQTHPITIDLGLLFSQLVGAWVMMLLFGSLSNLLNRLRQAHKSLATTHTDLARQNAELTDTHRQLEIIHELTIFLHVADKELIQQRLLKAVTKELDFSRAVVGLVNPTLGRLENWQSYPVNPSNALAPVPLREENGPIVEAVINQQVVWCDGETGLVADESFNVWLGPGNWLILPMIWQEQAVGVLVVCVQTTGPADMTDDRWAILTTLVSQAAAALGTIDKSQHLAVEQERNRIARDIHDTVSQSLFGIAFTLDACIKLLPQHAEAVKEELIEIQQVADQVRREVRQSILDLWPSELTEEQFQMDLCKYVAHCSPTKSFNVGFTMDGDFDGLSPAVRRTLYRVCQESLANAAKHAQTDSARVYLYVDKAEVYLSIRDKGRGFDPKPVLAREQDREQFGLRGMQERVQTLGGTCDILSQEGYGTQVLVRVPINENGKNGYG